MLNSNHIKYKRLINFGWNVLSSNYRNLNFPIKLNYAVTYRCNQKCLTCNIWQKPPDEEMTLEEIRLFFQKNSKFNWIDLTGGEIFLRKDIQQILQAIVANCHNLYLLHFPTNGSCLREIIRAADYLIESPIPLVIISVSLDGNEEIHNRIRGRKDAFKTAVETFLELKKRANEKFNVYAGVTISKFNVRFFPELLRKMEGEIPGFTYNDIHINFAQVSKHFYQNNQDILIQANEQLDIFREIADKTRKQARGVIKYLESRYQSLAVEFLRKNKNPAICQALSSSLFMDPKGDLYPCISWDKRLGKIKSYQYSLSSFLKNSEVTTTRKNVVAGKCPNCWSPCEAYQAIMAQTAHFSRWKSKK